ncbi:type IV pilus modification protein PilV [Pseudoxanthomonas winnipegensis]|uniref:Type IV pilus modification protein PilV n=1 Tax=Pseudoxanthomonas winnipegensis TaxID=2480810 RepID=A0A4Q8LFV0_9GAMM|nr:type IV pilus modification protein PilV [Pseudoxanthomonas winnipegensis]TAA28300.1 type IV pilus modification protein PilV [Pseudoxanthomonas winnipegensis]
MNHHKPIGGRHAGGFTLLEVMVAILILGFGLLGLAMMQTMSVRFSESSNQRTQATNLVYELLDQMRSNRLLVAQYSAASYSGAPTGTTCDYPKSGNAVSVSDSITLWQCQARAALGDESSAVVTYVDGVATVSLNWNDQRWEKNPDRADGLFKTGNVTMSSRL